MLEAYAFKSPIGILELRADSHKVTGLCLVKEPWMAGTEPHSDLLYEAYTQINEYFAGKRREFALPLGYAGTPFQKKVWDELRRIPYGETRSYKDIATNIGNGKACRAVGQANRKNPVLLIIPCHRVIGQNGSLAGFACGTQIKQYLLNLEKQMFEGGHDGR